jgi:hypothetical protein
MGRYVGAAAASGKKGGGGGDEGPLNKICRDVGKLSAEQVSWYWHAPWLKGHQSV